MKGFLCSFVLVLLVSALLLAPLIVTVGRADSFSLAFDYCGTHAHGRVRVRLPYAFAEGARVARDSLRAAFPSFLELPLHAPLRAADSLYAIFVKILRAEISGCTSAPPSS